MRVEIFFCSDAFTDVRFESDITLLLRGIMFVARLRTFLSDVTFCVDARDVFFVETDCVALFWRRETVAVELSRRTAARAVSPPVSDVSATA